MNIEDFTAKNLPDYLPELTYARDAAYLQILLLRLTEAKKPRQNPYHDDWRLNETTFAVQNPEVGDRLDDAIDAVAKTIRALQQMYDAAAAAYANEGADLPFDEPCGIPELDNWTPPPPKTCIISVKPKWARAFFDKNDPKTVELRKHNFGVVLRGGDTLLIYSTAPEAAVIGTVTVRSRREYGISTLLKATWQGALARVTEQEFADYYGDADVGVGVWVENAQALDRPVPLVQVRKLWGGWHPPQQIQQLSDAQISALTTYVTNLEPRQNDHAKPI
jgi:predicted transcriptional regulator